MAAFIPDFRIPCLVDSGLETLVLTPVSRARVSEAEDSVVDSEEAVFKAVVSGAVDLEAAFEEAVSAEAASVAGAARVLRPRHRTHRKTPPLLYTVRGKSTGL